MYVARECVYILFYTYIYCVRVLFSFFNFFFLDYVVLNLRTIDEGLGSMAWDQYAIPVLFYVFIYRDRLYIMLSFLNIFMFENIIRALFRFL